MVTVGVTGGIGSGKSTVCEEWARLGAYMLNADALAKELMVTNKAIRAELVQTFGEQTFTDGGELNRAYLAEEAFRKERVAELNAIVHPRLPAEVRKRMQKAENKGYKMGVYEAALLLESNQLGYFDYLVLVLADESRRLEWVGERDAASAEDIKSRMEKQRNFEASAGRADVVIRNDGTLDQLKQKAREVYRQLMHSGNN